MRWTTGACATAQKPTEGEEKDRRENSCSRQSFGQVLTPEGPAGGSRACSCRINHLAEHLVIKHCHRWLEEQESVQEKRQVPKVVSFVSSRKMTHSSSS